MKTLYNYIQEFLKCSLFIIVVFSMLVQPIYQSLQAINTTSTVLDLVDYDEDIEEERQESDAIDKKLELIQKDTSSAKYFKGISSYTSYADQLFPQIFGHKIPIPPPDAA